MRGVADVLYSLGYFNLSVVTEVSLSASEQRGFLRLSGKHRTPNGKRDNLSRVLRQYLAMFHARPLLLWLDFDQSRNVLGSLFRELVGVDVSELKELLHHRHHASRVHQIGGNPAHSRLV